MSDPAKFPGMRWHPKTGVPQVFQKAEEVPEGYLDYHPSNPPEGAKAEETTGEALPMTRDAIVAELSEGGIYFKKKAPTDELYALLVGSLQAHLKDAAIPFPEDATGPELLALVPKPE